MINTSYHGACLTNNENKQLILKALRVKRAKTRTKRKSNENIDKILNKKFPTLVLNKIPKLL